MCRPTTFGDPILCCIISRLLFKRTSLFFFLRILEIHNSKMTYTCLYMNLKNRNVSSENILYRCEREYVDYDHQGTMQN
jgi:hypothetical protein